MSSRTASSAGRFEWTSEISAYCIRSPSRGAEAEESPAGPQRHVNEPDQHRHFDQRTDYGSQRFARSDSKRRNRNGNCELEIISGGSEGQRRGRLVIEAQLLRHSEGKAEHYEEVDDERERDAQYIHRQVEQSVSLHREHKNDRVEKPYQCGRPELRH